jgi:hypothetical protein
VNCAPFLILYIVVALLSSACLPISWPSAVMEFLKGHKEAASLLSPGVISPVLALFALIVFAHVRGKRIGNAKLVWFPIAAIGLIILQPLMDPLNRILLFGPGKQQYTVFIHRYASRIIFEILFFGPIIVHTICCMVGAKPERSSSANTATRNAVYEGFALTRAAFLTLFLIVIALMSFVSLGN